MVTLVALMASLIATPFANFAYAATTGTLAVTVNPEAGKYNILMADGTKINANPFVGSQTFTDVPQSTYTVVFLPITGYNTTPAAQTVLVNADVTTPVVGTYLNDPAKGTLSVHVTPATGHYAVIDASGAAVTGSPFTGNQDLPLAQGSYTVTFLSLPGYATPVAQTVLVNGGATTLVNGNYIGSPSNGTLSVQVTPATGHYAVTDASGTAVSGSPFTGNQDLPLAQGSYTVTFLSLPGYATPVAQTVLVNAGATTLVNGNYIGSPTNGTLSVHVTPATGHYNVTDASGVAVTGSPFTGNQDLPLAQGSYTVTFLSLPGYATPVAQTVLVNAGVITLVNGNYTNPANGTLSVHVTPATGHYNVTDASGATVAGSPFTGNQDIPLAQGSYTVTFLSLVGYSTPVAQTVLVNAGATTLVNGNYISNSVIINVTKQDGTAINNADWTLRSCTGATLATCSTDYGTGTASTALLNVPVGTYGLFFNTTAGYSGAAVLTLNPQALAAGNTITFNLQYIETAKTGHIQINVKDNLGNNVADGQWNLNGPTPQTGTATQPVVAAVGSYTVTATVPAGNTRYSTVSVSPSTSQTLTVNGNLTFDVTYTLAVGTVNVTQSGATGTVDLVGPSPATIITSPYSNASAGTGSYSINVTVPTGFTLTDVRDASNNVLNAPYTQLLTNAGTISYTVKYAPVATHGTINVTQNGATGTVDLVGPSPATIITSPYSNASAGTGSYSINITAPAGFVIASVTDGATPANVLTAPYTQVLAANGTIGYIVNYSPVVTHGTINVTQNGATGTLDLIGPSAAHIIASPYTDATAGTGSYTLGAITAPAGFVLNNVTDGATPANVLTAPYTQVLANGGTITYNVNFQLPVGPAPVVLSSAGSFAILSKSGITNTGSHTSVITGNIGSSPITAAAMNTVFCSEMTGTIFGVDAAYVGSGSQTCFAGNPPASNKTLVDNAVLDMETAYADAAGKTNPTATELGAGNIGGMTLAPGLYKWSTDVTIPTDVTLSGGANSVWIFQIAGNLNIASAGSVPSGIKVILNGANASNVFWQVGGGTGATLGTYSTFNGTILSSKQIIVQTGAVLNGRALAQTQVTLDTSTVKIPVTPVLNTVTVNQNGGVGTLNLVDPSTGTTAITTATRTLPSAAAGAWTLAAIVPPAGFVLGSVTDGATPANTLTAPSYSQTLVAGGSIIFNVNYVPVAATATLSITTSGANGQVSVNGAVVGTYNGVTALTTSVNTTAINTISFGAVAGFTTPLNIVIPANTLAAGSTTNYVGAYVAVANSATITVTTANAHGTVSLNGNNLGTYNGVTPISAIVDITAVNTLSFGNVAGFTTPVNIVIPANTLAAGSTTPYVGTYVAIVPNTATLSITTAGANGQVSVNGAVVGTYDGITALTTTVSITTDNTISFGAVAGFTAPLNIVIPANTLARGSTNSYVGTYVAVANSATLSITTAGANGQVSVNGAVIGTYNGVTALTTVVNVTVANTLSFGAVAGFTTPANIVIPANTLAAGSTTPYVGTYTATAKAATISVTTTGANGPISLNGNILGTYDGSHAVTGIVDITVVNTISFGTMGGFTTPVSIVIPANSLTAGSTTNYVGAYVTTAKAATISVTTTGAHGQILLNGNILGTYDGSHAVTGIVDITVVNTISYGAVAGFATPASVTIPANTLAVGSTTPYSGVYTVVSIATLSITTTGALGQVSVNGISLGAYDGVHPLTITVGTAAVNTISFGAVATFTAPANILLPANTLLGGTTSNYVGNYVATAKAAVVSVTTSGSLGQISLNGNSLGTYDGLHTVVGIVDVTVANTISYGAVAGFTTPASVIIPANTLAVGSTTNYVGAYVVIAPIIPSGGGGGSSDYISGGGYKPIKGDMKLDIQKLVSLDGVNYLEPASLKSLALAVPENKATRLYTKVLISDLGVVSATNIQFRHFFDTGKSDMTADGIENLTGALVNSKGLLVVDKATVGETVTMTYSVLVHENGSNVNPAVDGLELASFGSNLPSMQDGLTYLGFGTQSKTYLYAGKVPANAEQGIGNQSASSTDSSEIATATLAIDVHANKPTANIGDTITFVATLRNLASEDLTNVLIDHTFDANAFEIADTFGATIDGNTIHWKQPILRPGQEVNLSFNLKVKDTAPVGDLVQGLTQVLASEYDNIAPFENSIRIGAAGQQMQLAQTGPAGILGLLTILSALATFAFGTLRRMWQLRNRRLALQAI